MLIHEVAKQSGVSQRTLRYYDEIGLLKPDELSEAGYRIYYPDSLRRLQQILFYRELDFPLATIQELLDNSAINQETQMIRQLELLKLKQKRLSGIIRLLENQLKGERILSLKEFKYDDIKAHEERYRAEVEDKYGATEAYRESNQRTAKYGPKDWEAIQEERAAIYEGLAARMEQDPSEPEVQALVKQWQELISRYFYPCNTEMLAGLGEMYQADERFRKNIDQHGEGLTDFLSAAIKQYTEK